MCVCRSFAPVQVMSVREWCVRVAVCFDISFYYFSALETINCVLCFQKQQLANNVRVTNTRARQEAPLSPFEEIEQKQCYDSLYILGHGASTPHFGQITRRW